MPKLVRLYIRHVAIGFGLSAVFVALLLWFNIGNLGHLILTSDKGWIAIYMLFIGNGVVFASVQFAIMIMRMAEPEEPRKPRGRRIGAILRPALVASGGRGKAAGPPKFDR
jgi:hypothetical protein